MTVTMRRLVLRIAAAVVVLLVLLVLRFFGFPTAFIALSSSLAAGYAVSRWKAPAAKPQDMETTIHGMEIGATGPSMLRIVLNPESQRVACRMTAEEARWLAMALNHWADDSDTIPLN